jgi:Pentapeptide repeats (8 copies)
VDSSVVGYDGGQYAREEQRVEQEPQTARERAVLLLRATFLPGWHPTPGQRLVWAIRGAIVLGVLVLIASAVDKTLWDWLGLLIVPVVLATGGYLFNSSQNRATQEAADQRAQEDALKDYLDHIGELLLDKDKPLRLSEVGDEVRSLARARTLTLLTRLDGNRKGSVLRFLYEARLIDEPDVVLDLIGADLSGAIPPRPFLMGVHLRRAIMTKAYLKGAVLGNSNLTEADLSGANLEDADLDMAFLTGADLSGARLRGADLRASHLEEGEVGRFHVRGAILKGANLVAADLSGANLSGADLSKANLTNAQVTEEQLREAESLEGATMPNGQTYEEWLKSKSR